MVTWVDHRHRSNKMHNALLISEVFGRVIDHLRGDARHPNGVDAKDTRKAGRRALAALARTCRAFSDPSLDALWRRLDSLKPFVLCLPTRGSLDDTTALPAFDDKEWRIVLRYAPRVRELKLVEQDYELNVNVLKSLWFRGTIPLLPNLKKLLWIHEIAPIRLFLSPSLVHLYVKLQGDDGFDMGFLECYHTQCPNLKLLYLGHPCHLPHVATAVSRAIAHSPNFLTTVVCDPIDEAALMHIANSPRLKSLDVTLHKHEPDNLRRLAAHHNIDHPPFENLQVLVLHLQDLSSIIPFLKSHQQPFKRVFFEFNVAPTFGVLWEFFTALGSTTRQKTLRQIGLLQSVGSREQGAPLHTIDFHILSLLMNFNLHEFDLDLINPVTLTNDELARLVQAWPDLERFYLTRCGWDCHSTSNIPTLKGLLLVAERCPKLHNLGLCVDARDIPPLSDDESAICNRAITELLLGPGSLITQSKVKKVTRFLLEHFPALTAVLERNASDQGLYYGRTWQRVDDLIQEALSPEASDSETSESDSETWSIQSDSESESVY